MSNFCAVISGQHGSKEQVAVVHHHYCPEILESVCGEMMVGMSAVIARLDSDDRLSISIEIRLISGAKIPIVYHPCRIDRNLHPVGGHARINSGGGLMVENVNGERKSACLMCGSMNALTRMTCVKCGESLWRGFEDRMYEYNRRLKEGIKGNNKRLVAITKQAIIIAVTAEGEKAGWLVDDNGYAVKDKSRLRKLIVPNYSDVEVDTELTD